MRILRYFLDMYLKVMSLVWTDLYSPQSLLNSNIETSCLFKYKFNLQLKSICLNKLN